MGKRSLTYIPEFPPLSLCDMSIYIYILLQYNLIIRKEVVAVRRIRSRVKKEKPTKKLDWPTILASALVDFLVGLLLLLIDRLT